MGAPSRPSRREATNAGTLLGLLLDEAPGHYYWLISELERALGWCRLRVDEVLAELERHGLVYRHGGFVLPTRAAVGCNALLR
jgi:hypothetical protein